MEDEGDGKKDERKRRQVYRAERDCSGSDVQGREEGLRRGIQEAAVSNWGVQKLLHIPAE